MKEVEESNKATPHKHIDKIIAWAKDTSQNIWVWNSIMGAWLIDKSGQWFDNRQYAVGDKPESKPLKTVVIKIDRSYQVTGRTMEVPIDATDKEILGIAHKLAKEGVKVSYTVLGE